MQLPDTKIFHYELLEQIGAGAMAVVYKAKDTKLDRTVAIKCFDPYLDLDDSGKERFMREARTISRFDHSNICTIYDMRETEDGLVFIVMAYYSGGTLRSRILDRPLPLGQVLDYGVQIARGLSHAHDHGIIHRDIKPVNILFASDNTVKIADFGIAKWMGSPALTNPGTVLGTIAYMSPEQAEGEPLTTQTDIWSFGVVLYEMFTGAKPFPDLTEETLYEAIITDSPQPLARVRPDLPKEVTDVVSRALTKSLAERYPSMRELLSDLERLKAVFGY